jgi:HTH-type transcriptional regulator/antitoxin HigA
MGKIESIPAEAFPPGEFIKDELAARGWEQRDLAKIMGRPERLISELVSGKRAVTAETAQQLGEAFGTGAQLWMNLEASYRLHRLGKPDESVSRRARLYTVAPIKEMVRRGWLTDSESIDVVEQQVMRFFRIQTLDEPVVFQRAAARKSTGLAEFTPAQTAWLFRARQLAETLTVGPFDPALFKAKLPGLKALLSNAEDVRQVPKFLSELGVRCVVVEHLPETRIDGACFWLDDRHPIVALSLRFDRIDFFWFTLLHELGHVHAGDGKDGTIQPDIDLVGGDAHTSTPKPKVERDADAFATSFIVPESQLASFITRVRPLFSRHNVESFAAVQKVHPGLVVGQLQHRRQIPYANFRGSLVKVRSLFLETALFDGWGVTPPTGR